MRDGTGRSKLVGIRVTAYERAAIARRVDELRAGGNLEASQSSVGYDLMQRGGLEELVAFYFGAAVEPNPHKRGAKAAGGAS